MSGWLMLGWIVAVVLALCDAVWIVEWIRRRLRP